MTEVINTIMVLIDRYGVSVTTMGFLFWVITAQLWPFAKDLVLRQLDEMKDERKQSQEERKAFLSALERRDNELEKISMNFMMINESIKRLNSEMMEIKDFVISTISKKNKKIETETVTKTTTTDLNTNTTPITNTSSSAEIKNEKI